MLSRSLLTAAVLLCLSLCGCSSADHGSIDSSRFGGPCTSGECATGGTCAKFSDIDSNYGTPFCVTTNPCDLVTCDDGGTCSVNKGNPDIVMCNKLVASSACPLSGSSSSLSICVRLPVV